jgi:hypothetical protein
MSASHGFRTGQVVTIANTTHFNGNFVLASASGSSFTITNATNNGTTDNAGGQTAIVKGITKVGDKLPSNNSTQQSTSNAAYLTTWRGIFAGGTTYSVGDVVWFNTGTDYNVFVSIANSNTGNNPAGGAADTKWQLFCYEIWKTNDGLTAVYIKHEYGQSQTNVPGMAVTFGTSSTNGQLGGNISFREFIGNSATATGTTSTFNCYFSSGQNASPFTATGSNFQMLLWRDATTSVQAWFFAWEREKDNTGADTGNSITFTIGFGPSTSGTGGFKTNNLRLSGANPVAIAQANSTFVADGAAAQWGVFGLPLTSQVVTFVGFSLIAIFPCFGVTGYVTNPLLAYCTAAKGDVTEATSFAITMYGVSHTYLPTKVQWVQKLLGGGTTYPPAQAALCMRYE